METCKISMACKSAQCALVNKLNNMANPEDTMHTVRRGRPQADGRLILPGKAQKPPLLTV